LIYFTFWLRLFVLHGELTRRGNEVKTRVERENQNQKIKHTYLASRICRRERHAERDSKREKSWLKNWKLNERKERRKRRRGNGRAGRGLIKGKEKKVEKFKTRSSVGGRLGWVKDILSNPTDGNGKKETAECRADVGWRRRLGRSRGSCPREPATKRERGR